MSRRTLMRAIGAGGAALAAPSLLTACGGGGDTGGSVSNKGSKLAPWPAYTPVTKGPKPDLPGTADGIQNGYLKYPGELFKAYNDKPGDGSTIHMMCLTYGTAPVPYAKNLYWQKVAEALGVKIKLTAVPAADFTKKMATVMAGNELPDILSIGGGYTLPREAQFVKSQMADLSEHLSGDSIKDYPHLAAIPTYAWEGMGRIGGGIYGVPVERPKFQDVLFYNKEMYEKAGYQDGMPVADFAAMAKKVSRAKKYAFGAAVGPNPFGYRTHALWHGAPNLWQHQGGSFTTMWGHDSFKDSLELMARMHKDGTWHPDSAAMAPPDLKTKYYNGTVGGLTDGFMAMIGNLQMNQDAFNIGLALPYKAGGEQQAMQSRGMFGYTVLKKAPEKRIKMLLSLLDYLASPFGSEEFELIHYGVEGTHFKRDKDNNPVKNEKGLTEVASPNTPFTNIADAPQPLHYPGFPEDTKRVHDWQKETLPLLVPDDHWGLQSAAFTAKGATLEQQLADGVSAIVTGRKPVSSWDEVYKKWQSGGGKTAVEEFAEEYAAAKKAAK
ncbi:extracellular solute-binding protein [Streptomyces sp. A7024]|uniref:Extracellular solute-binding protein n=2 Tax=Streptomyces coryli TaxID=1128680 RepID=A0A6G4UC90_9ACTN|nr:extracellular solute-binding protein [Streptomyces coryli]